MNSVGHERRQVTMREREQFARSTVDALSARIAILAGTGMIIAVNRAWRDFALASAALVKKVTEGANYLAVCDAATGEEAGQAAAFAAGIREVVDGERAEFSLEYPCPTPSGEGWFVGRVTRFDDAGEIRIVVAHEEITARKQAEEKLKRSEEWLRAIFEASRDGILVEDNELIVYVNRAYTLLFGYDEPEELVGRHVSIVLSSMDRERMLEFGRRRVRGEQTPPMYEFKGRRKDGTLVEVEASVSTSTIDGKAYITTTIRDIMERKQAEEALRQAHDKLERRVEERTNDLARANEVLQAEIVERKRAEETLRESEQRLKIALKTSKLGSWQIELATGTLDSSDTCKANFGLPPEAEFSYEALFEAIHPEDRARVRRAVEQAVETHADYDAEYRCIWPDGNIHWIIARGHAIYGPDQKPSRMVGVTLDITERKQSEEARGELLRRLVTAQEEERRRIARELHDQMGQHLTALTLGLASVKESCQDQPLAHDRLQQLQQLTNELGQEVHHLAWELRPTALDDWGLQTALSNYVEEWSERCRIPVDFHSVGLDRQRLAPEIEATIYRMSQEALTNILRHAEAHRVSLILERRPDTLVAIVEDDGRGFDTEAVMDTRETKRWLGLLGMKERVALVGGTLQVESTLGAGTTLFVRIPV